MALWRELLGEFLPDKELDAVFAPLPDCELVRFPRISRENVLNHAILGHELGHPIAADFLDGYETSKKYQRKVKLVAANIKKALLYQGVPAGDLSQKQGEAFEVVATLFSRALEELISDAVAVYTFGPSAVFAFYDLFCADLLDVPPTKPSYYPPHRYRLRLMYSYLQEQDYIVALTRRMQSRAYRRVGNSVRAMLNHLNSITTVRSDVVELRKDPFITIAYDWARDALPDAIRDAKRRVRGFIYPSNVMKREVPALLDLLFIGVPPGERGKWPNPVGVDWRSSLVAAWCMRLYLISSSRNAGDALEKTLRELSDLALKGIEYAILRGEYHTAYPKALV